MTKTSAFRCAVLSALLAAYGASAAAQAIEQDADNNYPKAQPLPEPGADGKMRVNGVIGVSEFYLPPIQDVDLYSFYANKGDLLEVDIDGGWKSSCGFFPPRCVDTSLTILGPDKSGYPMKRYQTSCVAGIWGNSVSNKDACILNFTVEESGIYIVAVTGDGTSVLDGGHVTGSTSSNGEYQLIVSGASTSVQQINIEVKPGSREFTPVNPKAKGHFPVALLSSDDFDALKVDTSSLTFGATGDERSVRKCAREGRDVNHDGKLDLVCHFDNEAANFGPDHMEGIAKGTIDGKQFEGHGILKVIPAVKKQK